MEENNLLFQIECFLEEFIISTGTRPLFVSLNRETYDKVSSQCIEVARLGGRRAPLEVEANTPDGAGILSIWDLGWDWTIKSINGIAIQISPSLKNGDIVFIGGDGFLNRYYRVKTLNGKEQPSSIPAPIIKFRQIELEEE